MSNSRTIITSCLIIGLLTLPAVTFAHGTEMHGKRADHAQMMKLHTIMPMLSVASAKLANALEKGEIAAINTEAERIIAAIPDLKKSKPHKNIKQHKQFVEYATKLEKAVVGVAEQTKKGNLAGARASFNIAEKVCAACHAQFRD